MADPTPEPEIEMELPESTFTASVRITNAEIWSKKFRIAEKLIAILEADCGVEIKRIETPSE